MKGIIAAQSPTVNDTCTDCGSFVDIGAVIDEHDIVLEIQFTGASAKDDAENMAERAKHALARHKRSLSRLKRA